MLPALPVYKIQSSDSSLSNKRLDLYFKGGVFLVSYKILILDLLTKRLAPSIISGLLLNNAHRGTGGRAGGFTGESFIAEVIRKGNPEAVIKCFSEKPQAVGKGSGVQGVEQFMARLQVNQLILYPRIKKSVKDSLDEAKGLEIVEHSIKFPKRMEEIHALLIELMQACLDELKTQIKKLELIEGNIEEVLDVKKALLKTFHGQFRRLLGRQFNFMNFKARYLLKNLNDINRLMWLLFNQDSVAFFIFLNELRFNFGDEQQFSIFTFCDDDTMKIIEKLHKLAKERVYSLQLKQ